MTTRSSRRFRPKLLPNETFFTHATSRVVDRRFIFGPEEKVEFLSLMRRYEAFGRVRVVGYCLMSNHFHILVETSGRPEIRPGEDELLAHVEETLGAKIAGQYRDRLAVWRKSAEAMAAKRALDMAAAGTSASDVAQESDSTVSGVAGELSYPEQQFDRVLENIWQRMYDVSSFILSLKQQFSHWYNKLNERTGTLWEDRFHSTLVQGGAVVAEMAAYIDLNPVRAGLVSDPKDYPWSQYGAAVAGDEKAREGVLFVAQSYASLTAMELEPGNWSAAQGRYRILLYRRGLLRTKMDGTAEGVFSAETVERVYGEGGRLPSKGSPTTVTRTTVAAAAAAETASASDLPMEPIGISYVGARIRYFTAGAVIGSRQFVDRIFQENRERFGKNRMSGARRMGLPKLGVSNESEPGAAEDKPARSGLPEADWGGLRVLRDLKKSPL